MPEHVTPEFDELTQYVYTDPTGRLVVADIEVTDEPEMPQIESSEITPYIPPPSLDERVVKVEAEVATTQEVLDVLLGGV